MQASPEAGPTVDTHKQALPSHQQRTTITLLAGFFHAITALVSGDGGLCTRIHQACSQDGKFTTDIRLTVGRKPRTLDIRSGVHNVLAVAVTAGTAR